MTLVNARIACPPQNCRSDLKRADLRSFCVELLIPGISLLYFATHRVIRFAFLAQTPNIVEQIAGDHQPADFAAESVNEGQAALSLAWDAQRKLLGFSLPA